MLYDAVLLKRVLASSIALFVFAILFYVLNVQYILRRIFTYSNQEAVNVNLTFKDAKQAFGVNSYTEKNPVDVFRTHLQLFRNEGTLRIQKGNTNYYNRP